jgi:hypothetical protein
MPPVKRRLLGKLLKIEDFHKSGQDIAGFGRSVYIGTRLVKLVKGHANFLVLPFIPAALRLPNPMTIRDF